MAGSKKRLSNARGGGGMAAGTGTAISPAGKAID
jgi:hypothetical protein